MNSWRFITLHKNIITYTEYVAFHNIAMKRWSRRTGSSGWIDRMDRLSDHHRILKVLIARQSIIKHNTLHTMTLTIVHLKHCKLAKFLKYDLHKVPISISFKRLINSICRFNRYQHSKDLALMIKYISIDVLNRF